MHPRFLTQVYRLLFTSLLFLIGKTVQSNEPLNRNRNIFAIQVVESVSGVLMERHSEQVSIYKELNLSALVDLARQLDNKQINYLYLLCNKGNYLVFTRKENADLKGVWLRKLCDSLAMINQPMYIETETFEFNYYKDKLAHINDAIVLAAPSLDALLTGYFDLVADLSIPLRDQGVTLYQALNSITFEPGFETETGADFLAEIVGYQPSGPDNSMNWILAKSFDENGNIISEGKQFFDEEGKLVQTQNKIKHRKDANTVNTYVLAGQTLRDALGRQVGTTLTAPTGNSEILYKPDFVQNSTGGVYDYRNFDQFNLADKTNNPDPVGGQQVAGTLGWYYSSNNTLEPYTPETAYPYSRQSFFNDGTGNVKRRAAAGEAFRMGNGHEVSSYIAPVLNELTHYLQVRNKYFTSTELGEIPSSLANEAVLSVAVDVNGKQGIAITDTRNNTLMVARIGSGNTQTDIQVNNTVALDPNRFFYFIICADNTTVNISGSGYGLYDINTGQSAALLTGSKLNKGYYKVVANSTAVTLTFSNWFTDFSYNFYNQLGQLVATISPEGVNKLLGSDINNYSVKTDVPFITLYEYDIRGRLVKTISPETGISEMIYRKDGQIRFSQNAEQKITGRYSYVNYDKYGRLIESGEYQPNGSGISFNSDLTVSSPMKSILEDVSITGGLTTGTKTDVSITSYDVPDNSHGVPGYTQNSLVLGGTVSVTKRYSTITNNVLNSNDNVSSTWYNYSEAGNVLWMIKYVKGLGYKTVDYEYGALDNVIKQVFQKNVPGETFVHYYEYDQVNRKLWKVYTNTTDNAGTKQLQATYVYYLHGPLKRVELAGNLQGIDYTYTLQGALKAINNSDKTKDPGGDGTNGFSADAFGMVLDYYSNDYQNNRSNVQTITGVNTSGITTDNYAGQIKAMSWFSKKPVSSGVSDNPYTYIYKYDDKYQFTESMWGSFTPAPNTFSPTNFNKETVKNPVNGSPAYDGNGNIQYLQRTDGAGIIKDKFTYNYLENNNPTNKLQNVVHDNNGTPQTYASYLYDKKGQIVEENTIDPNKKKYIKYDVAGRVVLVARDAVFSQKVAEYVYDESGGRIMKKMYNSSYELQQVTFYVSGAIYTQDVTGGGTNFGLIVAQEYAINGGAGRIGTYYRQSNVFAYELKDHQGNIRAIVGRNGSALESRMYADYYPFGMVIQRDGEYRFGYQGQHAEKDPETEWNAFKLRMYDSRIARWFSTDPYRQYSSPYIGMGNDPINGVDKNGGFWEEFKNWITGDGWMSNEALAFVKDLKAKGYDNIDHEWRGNRLTGHLNVSWNQSMTQWVITPDAYILTIDNPTAFSRKYDAKLDYIFKTDNGGAYALYIDYEAKLTAGLQAAIKTPFEILDVEGNLISYDLAKYSFVDKQIYHVFDADDNMKNLKFSSGVGVGALGFGGGTDISYAPGQGLEWSLVSTQLGINVELATNLMQKEAASSLGVGGSFKFAFVVGFEGKVQLKRIEIPNNDVSAWLEKMK